MPVQNQKRTAVAVVSILVIIAAVLVITVRQRGKTPKVNLDPFAAAGEVLAAETRAVLGGQGQVVVVTYDTSKIAMPVAAAQLKAFQDRLKKEGGMTVKAVEVLPATPNPGMATWSGAQYLQLAERHAGAEAIVSFVGPPFFTDGELGQLPAHLPRGLVLGSGSPGQPLRKLLERGVIQVAVVPRLMPPPPVPGSAAQTSRAQFDQQFQVVRKDTAGTLRY